MTTSKETIIFTRGLSKNFGGLLAVNKLDFDVVRGEIFGLVGPNGAGKSTALNMIGGTYMPSRGTIIFNNENITKFPPYRRCARGIGRVFQRNILFYNFNVYENMLAGFHTQSNTKFADIFFKSSDASNREKKIRDKAMQILEYMGLAKYCNEPVKNLPYGYQRFLSLGIALATQPQLLLLDEPLTGMSAEETASMIRLIKSLRKERNVTIILVEHNMKAVVDLCDRILVLNFGKKIDEGPPKEIMNNPYVVEAYLGVRENAS